jgi:hypothetical protein
MKRLLLLVYTIILEFYSSAAQAPLWEWVKHPVGFQNEYVYNNTLTTDKNGYIYVAGNSDSFTYIQFDTFHIKSPSAFITKYDASGKVIWAIGSSQGHYATVSGITVDNTGNVYVTGIYSSPYIIFGNDTLRSPSTNNNPGGLFLAKFDSSGSLRWLKGAGYSKYDASAGVSIDGFGNVYITGSFGSDTIFFDNFYLINSLLYTANDDIFLVKYDSTGQVKWANQGHNIFTDASNAIITDYNGDSYITGGYRGSALVFDTITLNNSEVGTQMFIAKFDSSGKAKWATTTNYHYTSYGSSITLDSNGFVYVVGNLGVTTYQAFIEKNSINGNLIWQKKVGNCGCNNSVAVCADGNIVTVGYFDCPPIINNDTFYTHSVIVKFDPSGNTIWAKGLEGNGLAITADILGNIYTTGTFITNHVVFDADTILNWNSNYNYPSDIYIGKLGNTITKDLSYMDENRNIYIYPNPARNSLNFFLSRSLENQSKTITITSVLGEVIVEQRNIYQNEGTLNIQDLSKGMYCLQVTDNKQRYIGRFIKQ